MRCGRSGSVTDRKPRAVAPDLLGAELGVGEPRDAEGDDALGVGRVPLLEQPVVPGARDGEAELGVGALREDPPAEAGDHRREVERRPHAVDVHVADAGVDVPAPAAHLVEAERLDLDGLRSPARHRVHADLRVAVAVELPHLVALGRLHHPGGVRLEPGRKAALEHVRRLDEMVVDRDHRVADVPRLGLGQEQVAKAVRWSWSSGADVTSQRTVAKSAARRRRRCRGPPWPRSGRRGAGRPSGSRCSGARPSGAGGGCSRRGSRRRPWAP